MARWAKAQKPPSSLLIKPKPKRKKGIVQSVGSKKGGRMGNMEARMDKMMSMIASIASNSSPAVVTVSNPPIGGLGPQGFGLADLGEAPGSSLELGNSPKLSLGSSLTQVTPTTAPAVVLVTNPPLCSAPAGPLGGGGSISVSAHAGPGVGYPASAPVHPPGPAPGSRVSARDMGTSGPRRVFLWTPAR